MRKALTILAALMLALPASASWLSHSNTATFDANSASDNWDAFDWEMSGREDQRIVVSWTNGIDLSAGTLAFRMCYPRNGDIFLEVQGFSVTGNTAEISFSGTNVPPTKTYYGEFGLSDTNTTPWRFRSLAKGKVSVTYSLWKNTNYAGSGWASVVAPTLIGSNDITSVTVSGGILSGGGSSGPVVVTLSTNALTNAINSTLVTLTNTLDTAIQADLTSVSNNLLAYTDAATNSLDTDLRAVILSATNTLYVDTTNYIDGLSHAVTNGYNTFSTSNRFDGAIYFDTTGLIGAGGGNMIFNDSFPRTYFQMGPTVRRMYDTNTTLSIELESRILYDSAGVEAIDYSTSPATVAGSGDSGSEIMSYTATAALFCPTSRTVTAGSGLSVSPTDGGLDSDLVISPDYTVLDARYSSSLGTTISVARAYVGDLENLSTSIASNGTFTGSASYWGLGGSAAFVASGTYSNTVSVNAGGSGTITQTNGLPLTIGKTYRVSYHFIPSASGTCTNTVTIGGETRTFEDTSNYTNSFFIGATATNDFAISIANDIAAVVYFDSISVQPSPAGSVFVSDTVYAKDSYVTGDIKLNGTNTVLWRVGTIGGTNSVFFRVAGTNYHIRTN